MQPTQPIPARFQLRLARCLPMVLSALWLAGCNTASAESQPRPPAERVQEMLTSEPKLVTYVENLRAIQTAAASQPELEPLSVKPSDIAQTHWIYEGYLSAKDSWPPPAGTCVALPSRQRALNLAAGKALPKKVEEWQVQSYRREIDEVTRVSHVFVCRQNQAVRGSMRGGSVYEGGFFKGECRAYDPWSKKYLGGFRLQASIPNKVFAQASSKRQQEHLDFQLEFAIANEAYRQAMGDRRPASSSPSFKCVWPEPERTGR